MSDQTCRVSLSPSASAPGLNQVSQITMTATLRPPLHPSCRSLLPTEHRRRALLHLGGRDVLLVRGHPPEMAEGIFELAGAVAVELVHDRLALPGAGGERFLEERIHVFD